MKLMRTLFIGFWAVMAASGQTELPPPVCPTCSPPESDLLPLLVVGSVMFGGGWLVRTLWNKRGRK